MPSFAILLCAIASVLGALAVAPLAPDLRTVVAAGAAAFGAYAVFGRCAPRFRVLLATALLASAANAELRVLDGSPIAESRTARYSATILERSSEGDGSSQVTLALDGGRRVLARLRDVAPAAGTRVLVRGRLEPFDEPRNPDEPSERALQAERGLDGRLEAASLLRTDAASAWSAATLLARAHEWAHEQLQARLGEPAASLVAGELWGERAALPPDLRVEFQETGTVHVLVTAGLHLGAVAALAAVLFALLALPRWAACAAGIALVWAFVWWSGGQLPAMRAATMASAALLARACGRATLSWNALALAALLLAFARPASVATASFALSFSCVGAIFACAGPLDRWIEARAAVPAPVREALVLTLATQAGIWPLSAAIFLQFTPYAVIANLAVVPCVAATMALGATQLALAWCGPLAQAGANLNSWLIAWTLGAVRALSSLPGAILVMTPPPAWCIAAYDVTLLATPMLLRRGGRTIAVAALAVASGLVLWPPRGGQARLIVTVLDVGQADAIVVQTPRGHAILVDAGGRLERGAQPDGSAAELVGERTVVPFLLRHGIHAVDAIVISHPHGDHAGGVAPVLRRLRVAEIADGGQRYGGHAYQDAIATARAQGVPLIYPRAGAQWSTDDGVTLRFIGPSLPFIDGKNSINDNSIAFVLQYHAFRMLFTGDAGVAAERRFLDEGIDLRADVLKVGHHGSAYSSSTEFIAAVHPRYAVISVGRHNLFGHPAPSTVETLARIGATIYRTDENAATTITTDGHTIEIGAMLNCACRSCRGACDRTSRRI
ncbi:MAG: DNA internalization-related competence protein ComEC/Rec2 [Candidatus Eremiobacteraeota bacterium]|nr:DNA internalization-related competence protein ComEC/Rec2 [Candidatus Eremiobacteraeota bacterium]MBV8499995.1 DNA internalization-related competence protein ComEC/Rec2 [Candidatus Eremiobacteraeota bacterium]